MRKRIISWVVLAVSSLLILVLLTGNFWIHHTKDFLLAKAERWLGRKISADRIEVTLWPLGARLVNFRLSEDLSVSENFLRAKALQVDLQLLPLLIGQFLPRIRMLDSPVFTIVHDDSGRYKSASILRNKQSNPNAADNNQQAATEKPGIPPNVFASLNVINGALRYRDLKTGRELIVTQINLKVAGSESDEPFYVELEAAVMAPQMNLKLRGSFGPLAGVRDYRDLPIDGNMQVDALDMSKVNRVMPQLKKGLPKVLQFDGIYTTKELKFKGSLNNLSLKGAITGTDASLRFE